ncbi:hypothetical protein CAPTEDRAFT_173543 [Capitella teleta]|uniref:DNA topoisomerase I n=1 Tax=Capitella teleta TaxID=283909 RepID=R7UGR3_CAPTE|nr:hypothetical protein CAPTEDRAFT_173543 [Capitella teleta]|eukprot:ELU02442.1 hypothetical protein CAPTEDRAFT_173543 [Capitella teleta]
MNGYKERHHKSHKSHKSSKHSHKDKDRHSSKHSSSSSKDKHRSSSKHSSSSSKDKDKHRSSKHHSSSSKHRHSSSSHKVKEERAEVKQEPVSPIKMKMDEDDIPLSARMVKTEKKRPCYAEDDDDEDDAPLSVRVDQAKKSPSSAKKRKMDDDDFMSSPKKKKTPLAKKVKSETKPTPTTPKKGKEKDPALQEDKWEWWKDEGLAEGCKWRYLQHMGPYFAPEYEPLPDHVRFYYDGKPVKLSPEAEEVAVFYGRMIDHDYTTQEVFNDNFLKDWRKVMNSKEKELLRDLRKCNFNEINDYFKLKSEERKAMSKEGKLEIKKQNEEIVKQYGFCVIDHHRQKIGNFRIEPPGLFRGRGDHPKRGMLKKRIMPEDVIINCSKDSPIPKPPPGHKWKEVRHDNTVTWLCSWTENIQGSIKYVMLNAASKLKGEKDFNKYETARKLYKCVDKIRAQYREDWKSKEMRIRQRAVAMYFIDKLALRAGNEKDEDTADTVGCCSIRVEHIKLHEKLDDKEYVVEFDFLGKDSIRYYNRVAVEKRVFKNLQIFMENKSPGDDLFDRLNTAILNKHLQSLMEGLTAKVFRTFNASRTLQEQLKLLTDEDDNVPGKMLSYNRANRAVAILCNHQRAVPKNFSQQMENLQGKIDAKRDAVKDAKRDYKASKADYKASRSITNQKNVEKKKKALDRAQEMLHKLEVQQTDKDENKEIALGTSKLNYLDPRISVAWCKKFDVPIEKIYNKTQREKFAWAIDMAEEDYEF